MIKQTEDENKDSVGTREENIEEQDHKNMSHVI